MSDNGETEDTVTIAWGIRGDSVTYPVASSAPRQAADELAALTNDMGLYDTDQEAK